MFNFDKPDSFDVKILRDNPDAKNLRLLYRENIQDRELNANVYSDWLLAGRCLRYAQDIQPATGLNRFQIWVNWTVQHVLGYDAEGSHAVMAELWESFALKPMEKKARTELGDQLISMGPDSRSAQNWTDNPAAPLSSQLKTNKPGTPAEQLQTYTPAYVKPKDETPLSRALSYRIQSDAMYTKRLEAILNEMRGGDMTILPGTAASETRESVQLKMKRLHEDAITPTFGTAGAACFDLYAIDSPDFIHGAYVDSSEHPSVTCETGWAFEVPVGWVMKVYSRSGQGFKDNTRMANCVGIIDSDYRGPLRVKLTRDDGDTLFVRAGDRVAQAMLERVPVVQFLEVDELSDTQRGDAGYGSTGR